MSPGRLAASPASGRAAAAIAVDPVRDVSRDQFPALFPRLDPATVVFALAEGEGAARVAVAFGRDVFDSDLFGLAIGRILEARAAGPAEYRALVDAVLLRARAAGFDQVLRRTTAGALPEIWALEGAGFELMDVGVTFARRTGGGLPAAPAVPGLRVADATDADVETIARVMPQEGWGSRFEADPAYDPSRVRELRARWLINSYRSRAQAFLVGTLDGQPAGYVTCRLPGGGTGEIELVGTLPAFRGRGVAFGVLREALAWFEGRADRVTVRTQATNVAAASLYERAGFVLHESDVTLRASLHATRRGPA